MMEIKFFYKRQFSVLVALFFGASNFFAQFLFNNGAILNLNGGSTSSSAVYLTLNNPPAIPLIRSGSGVNGIMMETEYSITKYNLGTATTSITVPFVSSNSESFPLTLAPTSAGTGTGSILFSSTKASTRSTGWDNTAYVPSDVTNMSGHVLTNNSSNVIDRFWIVDAVNYTSSPAANFTFSYINAEAAANGGNTFSIGNLKAQAFNKGGSTWGTFPISGTNTTGASTGTISGVSLSSGSLGNSYRTWTLVDFNNPLPIEMLYLKSDCNEGNTVIKWATATESNSSYFLLEKSADGITFYTISKIPSAGNSSQQKTYSYTDVTYTSDAPYYRLTEIDMNGVSGYNKIIYADCDINSNEESISAFSYENQVYFSLNSLSNQPTYLTVYDVSGRNIYSNTLSAVKGRNDYTLPMSIATGIYLFHITTESKTYTQKLFIQN